MSGKREIIVERPWLKVGCTLGEGPLYDPSTSLLHFVDISEKKVFHVDVHTNEVTFEKYDEAVSCLVLRRYAEGLACAAAQGFALLKEDSTISYLHKPLPSEHTPFTRFNDGACDSKGRFFAGTLYNPAKGIPGQLFRFDPTTNTCKIVDEGPFTDSNGLGWSTNEKTFYFTDSLVNKIYAYDYNDGELSNRRVFVDAIEKGFAEKTYCDGLCVDKAGGVWSARWGGSRIVRFDEEGSIDFQIMFPTALNVTSCCFGGPNNDTMFVTTAHCGAIGGDATRQQNYPDSGHIFQVDLAGLFEGVERGQFAG
ncbi:Regucalcin [Psilocybe cubensis]|uniref:SMP-30/Gluconolactonase/LRE-like region domain-containing protein n=2 Tax=Psilocybe cubensis TaxID=181762 RepID=A0A8H7YAE0_PSICU|nr:Regucalcin [Psilocybe cubensis]KAH9486855.1 Regucalcin [Psilocybe cubensis]